MLVNLFFCILKMKKIFLIPVFFLFSFFFFGEAMAADLVVAEKIQEINLVSGGAGHFSVQLKNNSDYDFSVTPVLRGFKFNENSGEVELIEDPDNPLINSWLKPLNAEDIELRAGREKKASFLITVPITAESKGYYAAVYFIYKPLQGSVEEFTSEAALLLLGIESPDNNSLIRGGQIDNLMIPEKIYYGPVKFNVLFKNTGKIHYKTQGEIEIYNFLNRKSAVVPIENQSILPGATLNLKAEWNRKYLLGRYLVVAKMVDGDGNQSVLVANFWAVPWKEFSIIFGIIILFYISKKVRSKPLPFE